MNSNDERLLSDEQLKAIRYQAMADACDSHAWEWVRRKAEEMCRVISHLNAQAEHIVALETERDRLQSQVAELLPLIGKLIPPPRPRCAKCGGSGSYEFVRGSGGDCPACDGRGY